MVSIQRDIPLRIGDIVTIKKPNEIIRDMGKNPKKMSKKKKRSFLINKVKCSFTPRMYSLSGTTGKIVSIIVDENNCDYKYIIHNIDTGNRIARMFTLTVDMLKKIEPERHMNPKYFRSLISEPIFTKATTKNIKRLL